MALRAVEEVGESAHPTTSRLVALRDELAQQVTDALAAVDDASSEAELVDQIAAAEQLRATVTALLASKIVLLARARSERELAAEVDPRKTCRGLAEEIGLACRVSPSVAARRLGSARAWWFDLPATFAALTVGEVSEQVAETVVVETRHLDAAARHVVDERLAAAGLGLLGAREAAARARQYSYEADREAYVARGRHERRHRRVGLRSAPDTMAVLSGYLPVEQGVACLAALRRHTDGVKATGDDRTRDQIMADTLVERLTGQARAADVDVEVQIVVPLEALTDPASGRTATVAGGGPVPAAFVRELIDLSGGRKRWRVLLASAAGHVVGIGARRRRFTGALADLVAARDQRCRESSCGAPIRHIDHVRRWSEGGPTSTTNGRGLCERHNLVREQPGWRAEVVHDGLGDQPHTVWTTTPTGHVYVSRAPDPP